MIGRSVPKLLQEAGEVRQALVKVGAGLPAEISAAEMAAKIAELEKAAGELDALNTERMRLVNIKGNKMVALSEYLLRARAAVREDSRAEASE